MRDQINAYNVYMRIHGDFRSDILPDIRLSALGLHITPESNRIWLDRNPLVHFLILLTPVIPQYDWSTYFHTFITFFPDAQFAIIQRHKV